MKNLRKILKTYKVLGLIYVIILFIIIVHSQFARITKQYEKKVNVEIANPIAKIVSDDSLTIRNLHNKDLEWNFSVNNHDNNKISEVLLSYKIKIDKGNLEDLQYKLYKIDNENRIELEINNDKTIKEFMLSNTQIQEDRYCLVIKTTDDIEQEGLEGNIKVSIESAQIN